MLYNQFGLTSSDICEMLLISILYQIVAFKKHEQYEPGYLSNDICVIKAGF